MVATCERPSRRRNQDESEQQTSTKKKETTSANKKETKSDNDNKASTDTKISRHREVDAFQNPTELFRSINSGDWESAISRALSFPLEVSTWIVRKAPERGKMRTKWKYLPLHLVCMRTNAPKCLFEVLLGIYPRAARTRDREGNLPIHLLCSDGSKNKGILDILLNAYPDCIEKKNSMDKTPLQILEDRASTDKDGTWQEFIDVLVRMKDERCDVIQDIKNRDSFAAQSSKTSTTSEVSEETKSEKTPK
eukprot:6499522-Ditylum_brightwellii.AAC.1